MVATELAVRESVRMLNDLSFESPDDMPINVGGNVVLNQVLQDDGSDLETSLSHVSDGQAVSRCRSVDIIFSHPQIVVHRYTYTRGGERKIWRVLFSRLRAVSQWGLQSVRFPRVI
jgi:hypothetical protein